MGAHDCAAVILAAGHGTRLRSDLPKVLHDIAGRPMLAYVLERAAEACETPPVVVITARAPGVESLVAAASAIPAFQNEARGTGDALKSVPEDLRKAKDTLVLYGDTPLITRSTVDRLLAEHRKSGATLTFATVTVAGDCAYGAVERDDEGKVVRITEARDRKEGGDPRLEREYNAGLYVGATGPLFAALDRISAANAQGEYYLTDVVEELADTTIATVGVDAEELLGINTQEELAAAEGIMRKRKCSLLMAAGVRIVDPATTYCDWGVEVEKGAVLEPSVFLRGGTKIASRAHIGPMSQITDSTVGEDSTVGNSCLEECSVGARVTIGQFARLRSGTVLADEVYVGTAAEIKNSTIGTRSFVSHFSCVLDATVGADVNIGAGTVTCNFDGFGKHRTMIDTGAFIGSDSILVAPCHIGKEAFVAAGSVVTRDVPDGALAIERSDERIVEGWMARRRHRAAMVEQMQATKEPR